MNQDLSLQCIIGKAPWSVWKGVGSFLLFEFGRKRKARPSGVKGTYTLWIYMAYWFLRRDGRQLAHSESPDGTIDKAAKAFERRKLREVILRRHVRAGRALHSVRMIFHGGYTLDAYMYHPHKPSVIFMLYSPSRLLEFDYEGNLEVKKMKKEAEPGDRPNRCPLRGQR